MRWGLLCTYEHGAVALPYLFRHLFHAALAHGTLELGGAGHVAQLRPPLVELRPHRAELVLQGVEHAHHRLALLLRDLGLGAHVHDRGALALQEAGHRIHRRLRLRLRLRHVVQGVRHRVQRQRPLLRQVTSRHGCGWRCLWL